jgi:hypothetical protein
VHAVLDRDARAEREDQDRNEEAPEVDFLAVAATVVFIGRPFGCFESEQQQALVSGVDQAVKPFGGHRRAAGYCRGNKLGNGNQ